MSQLKTTLLWKLIKKRTQYILLSYSIVADWLHGEINHTDLSYDFKICSNHGLMMCWHFFESFMLHASWTMRCWISIESLQHISTNKNRTYVHQSVPGIFQSLEHECQGCHGMNEYYETLNQFKEEYNTQNRIYRVSL